MPEVAAGIQCSRIILDVPPFLARDAEANWQRRGQWPANWIHLESAPAAPFVSAYRLNFKSETGDSIRIHVAADERYELFLDGERMGSGNDRGDLDHWYFDTYDLVVPAGNHCLAARVWSLGDLSAYAQFSLGPGFLLAADAEEWKEQLSTGFAPWKASLLDGYRFTPAGQAWGTGANVVIDGVQSNEDWKTSGDSNWLAASVGEIGVTIAGTNDRAPARALTPSTIPAMLRQPYPNARAVYTSRWDGGPTSRKAIHEVDNEARIQSDWNRLLNGSSLEVAANQKHRILIDFDNYVCGFPEIQISGGKGASIRVHWQESLFEAGSDMNKGNRDEIEGKFFTTIWSREDGIGDTFISGGGSHQSFSTLWWQAGRFIEVCLETKDQPLTVESFRIAETHYPYEKTGRFQASDPRLESIIPIAFRTLEMCSHETYMDCPFYEQLQYVGDTRLQILATFVTTGDARLPRKAIEMFDASRQLTGLTQSRYPTRVRQVIPPFSLWYIGILHDFALWQTELEQFPRWLIGARGVIDYYRNHVNSDGLVTALEGWNYVDWVPEWKDGIPPEGHRGLSSVISLLFVNALRKMADLEAWFGEPEFAERDGHLANRIYNAVHERFFDAESGLLADDLAKKHFSEHAQILSLLSGESALASKIANGLTESKNLSRTTIYFTHYLFEAYAKIGRIDLLVDRLQLWFDHLGNGMRTTIEMPEPTRSDCHAWGAHPVYHYFASILGIQPEGPGFTKVRVSPNLGPLEWAEGNLLTPFGVLSLRVDHQEAIFQVPEGLSVTFNGKTVPSRSHSLPR